MKQILIVTSVEKERRAVEAGLKGDPRFLTGLCGVGPVEAAVRTMKLLSTCSSSVEAVLNLGVAGGIPGQAAVGEAVLGTTTVQADLGFEQADGSFEAIEALGFTVSAREANAALYSRVRKALPNPIHEGPIVTQSTVTGTKASLETLLQRVPDAMAEGMEGFAVHAAAEAYGIPALELRAISNPVGPRKRGEWRLDDALHTLTGLTVQLKEGM